MADDRRPARGGSPLAPFLDLERGRIRFSVRPPPEPDPMVHVDRLLAGAAEADLTPPPGMPKAGYSRLGHTGTGFRTRLRARVVHLRAGRTSLALVACDLHVGSAVLQHLVARAVAEDTDVGLAGLFMGVTHTHGGPSGFHDSEFYARWSADHSGFDPAYTHFLVERIAGAVIAAVGTRRPARLAAGSDQVWGVSRNRAHAPHVRNDTVADKRTDPQRKWVGVNPWLHLLRIDTEEAGGALRPLAAWVSYSIHGVAVSEHTPDYNGDLWPHLTEEIAARVTASHGRRPIVAAVQGTHGDVTPAVRPGLKTHPEAERLGRRIGAAAADVYRNLDGVLSGRVNLAAGLREVDLRRSRPVDGVTLARRPAVGAPVVAGAIESQTTGVRHIPPFSPGHPKRRHRGDHGPKWVLGSRWLQPLLPGTRPTDFPYVLAVQVLRIGSAWLVGLPFELTVETGRRIEAAVASVATTDNAERVIVCSLVNGYLGYAVTPEEYLLQYYEGGQTLYGPNTEPFVTAHCRRLAAAVVAGGTICDVLSGRSFSLTVRRYLPRPEPDSPRREWLGRACFFDPTVERDGFWEARWRDVAPGNLHWHEPMLGVEASDDGGGWYPAVTSEGRRADDQGSDIEIAHVGPNPDGGHTYLARWYNPQLRADRRHRMVLCANAGRPELASEWFD